MQEASPDRLREDPVFQRVLADALEIQDKTEYYWIVLPNTAKKHVPGERKPRIDLGESNSVSVKNIEKTPVKSVKELNLS